MKYPFHLPGFMITTLIILIYGFIMGMKRGASSCLALCMPSIIPTIIEEGGSWKKGVGVALWFNAPRIFFLTLLGMVIGAGGFVLGTGMESVSVGSNIWIAGYVAIGAMMFVYGIFVFASADDRMERLANGEIVTENECKPKHPIISRIKLATPKSRFGLMLWGGIVSIACIGETVLSLETIFIGLSATTLPSPLHGALLGGAAFFLFSLGAAFPSLIFAGLGSRLADREGRLEILLQAERISGALMIFFGLIFISVMFIL